MKKSLLIVALAMLVIVTPVLAASPGKIFTVYGTISTVASGSITVDVTDANKLASGYIGKELEVKVTTSTTCYAYDVDLGTKNEIDCATVAVEDTVHVRGRLTNAGYIAQVVTIDVECQN